MTAVWPLCGNSRTGIRRSGARTSAAASAIRSASATSERAQRLFRVAERVRVHRLARTDQFLDRVVDVPDVDVHAGQYLPAAKPERDELTPGDVTTEDDLVVAAGFHVAGVLHAQVVLVGEEVGHPVVGNVLAEHRPGGCLGLVQRIGPVLDPDVLAEQGVEGARNVSGGVDVGAGGAQLRVDKDAVA